MSRTRNKKVEGIKPQRKRRRRRTKAQMAADLATAKSAISNIFAQDGEDYESIAERLRIISDDINARYVVLHSRWTKDGEEIDKLRAIRLDSIPAST